MKNNKKHIIRANFVFKLIIKIIHLKIRLL